MASTQEKSGSAEEKPLRADAVRNRAKVLAGARDAFAEHGIDAQMEDIAARAGVGVGTVYRHFPTKQALIEALVAEHFSGLIEETRRALDAEDPGAAFFDLLEWCYRQESQRAFDALGSAVSETEAKQLMVGELCDVLDVLIDRAQEAGAVRQELCADDVGMLMSGIAAARQTADWHREKDPARRYFDFVVDGLRAPGSPPRGK